MHLRHTIFSAIAIIAGCAVSVSAADIALPDGDVILTISGAITETNTDGTATFDLAMLAEMPVVNIETTTVWTDGLQSFTGVAISDLLDHVGATGTTLRATAINDYAVEIPVEDWTESGPIIAYLNNGAPMSVRDKGPLWIVYPFDQNAEYQSEVVYSRSIWQLDRIVVED